MYEGKYIQTCTPELALSVGLNLRYEDRRETEETSGLCAEASIIESFYNSAYCVYFSFFLCIGTLTLRAKSAGGLSKTLELINIPDSY